MILGNVINKLSESAKQRAHIPYRDSKLTRILQPALGGNAKTSIICTVAPEEVHIEETRGTLRFASRAKRVTNCAQVNEILTDAALLKRQKLEIEELCRKLQGQHSEVLEQVILKQRNDMHKSELECEKLAVELEEERKACEALENCVKEQQMKIESLSKRTSSLHQPNSATQESADSGSICEELSDGNRSMIQGDAFRTLNFIAIPNDYVAKWTSCSRVLDLSPIPDNFANVANEDLSLQLHKGCITNLDMLQMTPNIKHQSVSSTDTSLGLLFRKGGISEERSQSLKSESTMNKSQLNSVNEQCAALERECNQLREEKESLAQALSISKQDSKLLKAEKEGLLKDLNVETQKMKDLKEEIRLFSLAFTKREGLLTSLYTKSKAMMGNLNSSGVPIPKCVIVEA